MSWYASDKVVETKPDGIDPKFPSNLLEACVYYFERLGGKPSCFADLKTFVEKLNAADKLSFLEKVDDIGSTRRPADTDKVSKREEKTTHQIEADR